MAKKILFSVLLFLAFLEVLLRVSGKYNTPNEKSTGVYYYRYRNTFDSWQHAWKPNMITESNQVEFVYKNWYNEFGIREHPLDSFTNDTSLISILCLGDSFTEGDGTCYDSSWVRVAEQAANSGKKKYQLYNAGVCGSDVFYNHQWLKSNIMHIKPQLVVECINSSDLCDVAWMGGNERFNKDGSTSGKVGPKWEVLYRFSHVFRAIAYTFVGYNDNLMKKNDAAKAVPIIKQELIETQRQLAKQGINYVVVLQLCPHELFDSKFINQNFMHELGTLPFCIDISDHLIKQINPNNIYQYSWPINGHFNRHGYRILGKTIYEQAIKRKLLKLP